MLKTTMLSQVFVINKIFIIDKNSSIKDNNKLTKKFIKLKTKKLSKLQKLAKLRKKLLTNENLLKFDIKKTEPSFLTFNTRIAFNYLWLTFIKTSIFQYFDLKYYILIKINAFSYIINSVLS